MKIAKKFILLLAAVMLVGALMPACVVVNRPSRRIVRTWRLPNGCRVRRVIFPCYNRRGNLKREFTICGGRRVGPVRQWVHRDRRCFRRYRTAHFDGP